VPVDTAGKKALATEIDEWTRFASAVSLVIAREGLTQPIAVGLRRRAGGTHSPRVLPNRGDGDVCARMPREVNHRRNFTPSGTVPLDSDRNALVRLFSR